MFWAPAIAQEACGYVYQPRAHEPQQVQGQIPRGFRKVVASNASQQSLGPVLINNAHRCEW